MSPAQDKLQRLLRELFQFDCADLDFGIYRITNYKRDVIEKFISTDLPEAIADELNRGALADQIAETLGKNALDADGNLVMFQDTEIGRKYLDLRRCRKRQRRRRLASRYCALERPSARICARVSAVARTRR